MDDVPATASWKEASVELAGFFKDFARNKVKK